MIRFIETDERKDIQIKVRISRTERDIIDEYCAANDITISDMLRQAIAELINGGK